MEPSDRKVTTPSWPDRWAWVPPHSSCAQSPTETTRTRSPYFSPKSAMAPIARASSCVMVWAETARSSMSTSLTCCSTSRSTSGATAVGLGKSNRRRPGAFSEPIWVAVSPSRSRKARWIMCVAVWAREIALRRATSTTLVTAVPLTSSPSTTSPRWMNRPGTGVWTS